MSRPYDPNPLNRYFFAYLGKEKIVGGRICRDVYVVDDIDVMPPDVLSPIQTFRCKDDIAMLKIAQDLERLGHKVTLNLKAWCYETDEYVGLPEEVLKEIEGDFFLELYDGTRYPDNHENLLEAIKECESEAYSRKKIIYVYSESQKVWVVDGRKGT